MTDDEVDLWRASLLGLRFPHEAFPEKTGDASFRPAHVMLSMLEQGPVPGQGLAFAFAAGSELPNEIQRLRNLAARWSDQNSQALAAEASTTVSELRNNAKVFPGLLEQVGLIRRSDGWAYATTDGLDALGVGRGAPPALQTSSVTGRRRRSRPIGEEGPTSWVPDPIDPEDAAERAFLGILRRERANSAHEAALYQLNDWLLERGFRTAQAEYDILATRGNVQVLVEVKSLSAKNRRTQTVRAIGQLAYYHHGLTQDAHEHQPIVRMTFFDREPGDPTILSVLEQENIQVAWVDDDQHILFADPGFHQLLDTTE
ncbi:MAG: hypothetical protein F4Y69_05615 [Chloroflexi bacterium]|nr:hypothetical protein [Chloroflexota bacterium]